MKINTNRSLGNRTTIGIPQQETEKKAHRRGWPETFSDVVSVQVGPKVPLKIPLKEIARAAFSGSLTALATIGIFGVAAPWVALKTGVKALVEINREILFSDMGLPQKGLALALHTTGNCLMTAVAVAALPGLAIVGGLTVGFGNGAERGHKYGTQKSLEYFEEARELFQEMFFEAPREMFRLAQDVPPSIR